MHAQRVYSSAQSHQVCVFYQSSNGHIDVNFERQESPYRIPRFGLITSMEASTSKSLNVSTSHDVIRTKTLSPVNSTFQVLVREL
jgi:hypothetical protein